MNDIACPFCSISLGKLDLASREEHVFNCVPPTLTTSSIEPFLPSGPSGSKTKQPSVQKSSDQIKSRKRNRPIRIDSSSDSDGDKPKQTLKNAKLDRAESRHEADIRLALALSKSAEDARDNINKSNKIHMNELSRKAGAPASQFDLSDWGENTVYDESFDNPILQTKNRIFDPKFRNDLLTSSQQDSSLLSQGKEPAANQSNGRDDNNATMSDGFEPEEATKNIQDDPEVLEGLQDSQNNHREAEKDLADWNEKSIVRPDIEWPEKAITLSDSESSSSNNSSQIPQIPKPFPTSVSTVPQSIPSRATLSNETTILSKTNIDRQINETQFDLEIRTLSNTLDSLRKNSSTDGDLLKYSKSGKLFKFHRFWVSLRCPELIHLNTKLLDSDELENLHKVIYSDEADNQKSKVNDTSINSTVSEPEKSFIFSAKKIRKSTATEINSTDEDRRPSTSHEISDGSECLFNDAGSDKFSDSDSLEIKDNAANKNITLSNFDFDSSDPGTDTEKPPSPQPERLGSPKDPIVLSSGDSSGDEQSPVLDTKRLKQINQTILTNSVKRKSNRFQIDLTQSSTPLGTGGCSINETPQNGTPIRSNVERPRKSLTLNLDDSLDCYQPELPDTQPMVTSFRIDNDILEIPSSPEANSMSAPSTPHKPKRPNVKEVFRNDEDTRKLKRKSMSLNTISLAAAKAKISHDCNKPSVDLKAMGIEKDPIIETMSKADLIQKCVAYGLKRTLGIREMRSKLNEINAYQKLYGNNLDVGKRRPLGRIRLDKKISSKLGEIEASQPVRNRYLSQSDDSESNSDDYEIESEEDLPDDKAFENKRNFFFKIIRSNAFIYNKILHYEPVDLAELDKIAQQNDIKFEPSELKKTCDHYGITFFDIADKKGCGNIGRRRRKK